jgi:outer membrane protein assembly factor BamB
MRSLAGRPKLRRVLIAIAVVVVLLGVLAAIVILHSPGNVSHPNLSFTAPRTTPAPPSRAPKPKAVRSFVWPVYGFDNARTRDFNAPGSLAPPFHVGWRFNDYALLEFPPVIYGRSLFVLDDDGSARSIDAATGKVHWFRKIGALAAASPAVAVRQHLVVMVLLSRNGHSPGNGEAVGLSMSTGHVVWTAPVPAGTESSPIVNGDSVFFGSQNGTVYSLNVKNGHQRWTYHAAGAVKGGLAYANGTLYFGDYAGHVYAVNAGTGHQVWAMGTSGTQFGFGSGNFYSTPAVAFGRVYMGNTDGRVYSFAQATGQLAWATGTGAYVYASAAVADVKGLGPTVYIGSYDGNFYAFNAQSGATRWSHPAGGRISGSATIVGGVVYYADLGTRSTTGLDARTGRVVFSFPDGAFNPIVADYGAIYMSGYSMLYQLLPKAAAHPRSSSKSKQAVRVRGVRGGVNASGRHRVKATARHARRRHSTRASGHSKRKRHR